MLPSVYSLRHKQGFTLVELLLALGISVLVAVLAYAGVSTAMDADAGLRTQAQLLSDIQRTLNIMEEDLLHIRPRSITTNVGSTEAALSGGSFSSPLLAFTRAGVGNPAQLPRSEMQRVSYLVTDGRLWRLYRQVLDGADTNIPPQSVLMLEGVKAVSMEFLPELNRQQVLDLPSLQANAGLWEAYWDSSALTVGQSRALPLAVRLTLDIEQFGQVQRVIELP